MESDTGIIPDEDQIQEVATAAAAAVASSSNSLDINRNPAHSPQQDEKAKNGAKEFKLKPMSEIFRMSQQQQQRREFRIFNLFTDLGRMMGISKRKRVRFPPEVIQKAEDKGELNAGTNVPLSEYSYRAAYSQQKSKVVQVLRNRGEFRPKLPWIKNTTKCELRCEKMMISCGCINEYQYQDPRALLKEKKRNKKKKKNVRKMSKLTESFMSHVNTAEFFLSGHKTRTLCSALEDVDGDPPVEFRFSGQSFDDDSNISTTEYNYHDELPTISASRVGKLAMHVWIFGMAVPLLFVNDDPPSEASYRKLMANFASLAMSANEAAIELVQQSKDFYNYSHEAMRVIRNLQLKMLLLGDTSVPDPIHLGDGLIFLPGKDRPNFEIFVAKTAVVSMAMGSEQDAQASTSASASLSANTASATPTEPTPELEFTNFKDLETIYKVSALNNLISTTLVDFDHAKHQIDFLVDDIKETTYDDKNDSDLLYRLSEMYHCFEILYEKSLIVQESEAGDSEPAKTELITLCETLSKFVLSLNSFITASFRTSHMIILPPPPTTQKNFSDIFKKIMEVRDMIQLVYNYFELEAHFEVGKLMPPDLPRRIGLEIGLSHHSIGGGSAGHCFFSKKQKKRRNILPVYKGADAFRIAYEDGFLKDYAVDGYTFRVRARAVQKEEDAALGLPINLKFRHKSISSHPQGYEERRSRDSASSMDMDSAHAREAQGTVTVLQDEVPQLKSILKHKGQPVETAADQTTMGLLKRAGKAQRLMEHEHEEDEEEDKFEDVLRQRQSTGKDAVVFKREKGGGGNSGRRNKDK